jgi:tetratricopeptide (TPR) repeat protein
MESNEEKQLKEIVHKFSDAIQKFTKKDYEKAANSFDTIIEKYKESEYYSVLEIQTRAKTYKKICHTQQNPVKIELKSNEDYLHEGIFCLNSGNFERALEHFDHLEKNGYEEAYINYLKSLMYLKQEDVENAMLYLKKSIGKDEYFKIIAYNEPDFEDLLESEDFLEIVE